MSRNRALLRLAARDARRDGWRTVLVVTAVVLPVFALAGGILAVDTMQPTGEERATGLLGQADARLSLWSASDEHDTPIADLDQRVDPTVRLEPIVNLPATVELLDIERGVQVSDLDLSPDALAAGQVELVEGRAAVADDEVVVTAALAELGELAIGDAVDVMVDPSGSQDRAAMIPLTGVTVVGVAERLEFLDERAVYVAPGVLPHELTTEVLLASDGPVDIAGPGVLFAGDTLTEPVVWFVETREQVVSQRFPGNQRIAALLLGGLAIVETALLAGAAFAVSVRRRQRELGLLAATGGRRRDVRRSVLWTGGVISVAAGVIGILLAIGALLAAMPVLESVAGRRIAEPRIDAWWLLTVGLVGMAGGLLGAWLPARGVARLPVTVALGGRRPVPEGSRRTAGAGLLLIVFGLAVLALPITETGRRLLFGIMADVIFGAAVMLIGCVAIVLGAGLLSPTLLGGLGRLAPRLGVGPRLAVRDAARFRMRNGPLVTAAMAALAASITVTSVLGSMEREERAFYTPTHAEEQIIINGPGAQQAAQAIGDELGAAPAALQQLSGLSATTTPRNAGGTLASVVVATPELLGALAQDGTDTTVAPDEAVLVGDESDVVEVRWMEDDRSLLTVEQVRSVPARGVDERIGGGYWQLPALLLPPDLLAEIEAVLDEQGLQITTQPLPNAEHLLVLDAPVDDEAEATARRIGAQAGGDGLLVSVERGYQDSFASVRWAVLSVGLLAGLAVVAIALALAATEGRRDTVTMAAVGASRRARLGLAAGRAAVLSGLASLLAVPVGLAPALMLTVPLGFDVVIPWFAIAVVVIGVPVVATVGAWLAAWRGIDRVRLTRVV
ncbi:MAG: FtsX-like permease family protein [Nitriliruptoraceae bacterium]|nr:FtsX-like permease family protein [Nitriliruptoraceae bacterium]